MKFPKKYLDVYTKGDAFEVLKQLPHKSVDLLFTSIPDISQMFTETGEADYLEFIGKVISYTCMIVKPKGFVVFSQQDRRHKGKIIPKHVHFIQEMKLRDWILKDEKIIVKDGLGKGSPLFQFTYQYCSVFTKEGKIKRKGEYLQDIIVDTQKEFGGQKVWSLNFCKLMIETLTVPGAIVVDPFAGAGPVLYAAKLCNRHYWGAEIAEDRYNKDFKFFKQGLFTL